MEGEAERFLRKLRQIEEHSRALTRELPPGDGQDRARLLWGLAAHLVLKFESMENQKQEMLKTLREIERQADALARALPPGLPLHRARQIRPMAAHLALQTDLEKARGHLYDAAA